MPNSFLGFMPLRSLDCSFWLVSFARKSDCPAVPLSLTVDTRDSGTAKGEFWFRSL